MITNTIHLTPPRLQPENIDQKIICIRSHRERIFQVSTQIIGSKLICHNYGHGGAGWTFLFGCVNEALRQFQRTAAGHSYINKPICVVGAGCYGLLTAIMLTRAGHTVRIVAKETEDVPSNKAGGFFFPRPRKVSTPQECAVFEALGMESYATYIQINAGEHPFIRAGAKLLPTYYGMDLDPGFAPYVAAGLMKPPQKNSIHFGNGKQYEAMTYQTIFMDAPALMQELWREARELGIPVIQQEITSFDDLEEHVIFNCSGQGAQRLTGDTRIVPVQGHLITLKHQPPKEQLQYLINVKVVMTDAAGRERYELIYFAPKGEGILGITFIRGQNSLTANMHEFDRLLQRSQDFFGST